MLKSLAQIRNLIGIMKGLNKNPQCHARIESLGEPLIIKELIRNNKVFYPVCKTGRLEERVLTFHLAQGQHPLYKTESFILLCLYILCL